MDLSSPRNSAGPGSAGCRSAALSSSYGTKRSAWAWSRADSAAARSVAQNFIDDQRAEENKKLRSDLRRELGHEHELEDERDAYIATHHLSDKDVANLMRELGTKKEELAKELEKSMQRDFELRRLQANLELTSEELNAAKSTIIQKDEELLQREKIEPTPPMFGVGGARRGGE